MSAPRTTIVFRVRSYEIRGDGRVGSASFLNWCQEAAYANSTELGFSVARYQEMGVGWVMRETELEILDYPRYDEDVYVTTWVADFRRVQSNREYEARREDGSLLARCDTKWVMLDRETQRPTRIPDIMLNVFQPAQDFAIERQEWPTIEGDAYVGEHHVSIYDEDELAHVNNANYLKWVEENARRASQAASLPAPTFRRHLLEYRLPAFKGDVVTTHSVCVPFDDGLAWRHEVRRGEELLVVGRSLSA
jgi:acyl-CoA thioesterase FadM